MNANNCVKNYVTYTSVRSFAGRQQHKQAHISTALRDVLIARLLSECVISLSGLNILQRPETCQRYRTSF